MNLQPINPAPRPGHFNLRCCRCGITYDAASSAADLEGEPFKAYYCWHCQPPEVRGAVERATVETFRKLSPAERHTVRVRLYGSEETQRIEARERIHQFIGA